MKSICLILIFQGSLQLRCDRNEVNGIIGGVLVVICQYQTSQYLFNKKYWCLGESRSTCEILMDTDGYTRAEFKSRYKIQDVNRRDLFIQVADLQISDTGVYWVGIDKIYSDIMYRINVRVSEVPVSEPRVWSLSPPEMSCWGKPLTVHCASEQGTRIKYGWFRATGSQPVKVEDSSNLQLHCELLTEDGRYFCIAGNSLGNQHSQDIIVQLLRPAGEDCIYILGTQDDNPYDCGERLRTTTAIPLEPTDTTDGSISSLTTDGLVNGTRTDHGFPLWYEVLRWLLFAILLMSLCLVPRLFQGLDRPTRTRTPSTRSRKHNIY